MNAYLVNKNAVATHWDIFCRIVDNYGDIGVCWRLAKQLVNEHHLAVRLFIDLPQVAQKIIPDLNTSLTQQIVNGVEVRVWDDASFAKNAFLGDIACVVIEGFACDLPKQYIAVIQSQKGHTLNGQQSTVWLNLEYLSAENWVASFHAKPSVNPTTGLTKHYFFPGFSQATGGLLREVDLIAKREIFQTNRSLQLAFLQRFHLNTINPNVIKISLFCYPHAPLLELLKALSSGKNQIVLYVPESQILTIISQFFNDDKLNLKASIQYKKGCLSVHSMPFLSQDDYDQLLWCCDLNFVRGEDSWVRAIWAGKPFIWQPYFQQEETHIIKLNAFLDDYSQKLDASATKALHQLNNVWANPTIVADCLAHCWCNYIEQFETYKAHALIYSKRLSDQVDLASRLVDFCSK